MEVLSYFNDARFDNPPESDIKAQDLSCTNKFGQSSLNTKPVRFIKQGTLAPKFLSL